MSSFHTDHVRVLVVTKVHHVFRLVHPRVPQHGVRKVVLQDPHLPSRHHVGDYVLLRRVLVDPVGPLTNSHNVSALLVQCVVSGLVHEGAAVQPGYLAPPHVRHLEVGV